MVGVRRKHCRTRIRTATIVLASSSTTNQAGVIHLCITTTISMRRPTPTTPIHNRVCT